MSRAAPPVYYPLPAPALDPAQSVPAALDALLFDCPRHMTRGRGGDLQDAPLRITPTGCARAWSLARRCSTGDDVWLRLGACRGCAIGAQHAGQGPPEPPPAAPLPAEREQASRKVGGANAPRLSVTDTHMRQLLHANPGSSTGELAALAGISRESMRHRLARLAQAGDARQHYARQAGHGARVSVWEPTTP